MPFKSIMRSIGTAVLLSSMCAVPAFAQSTSNTTNSSETATSGNNNQNKNGLTGTLQKTHGMWRSSAINGANVYNTRGQQLGTVDNLLIDSSGKVGAAVVSVGGFAGVGNKLVKVPFTQLNFVPSNNGNGNSNTQAQSGGNSPQNYSIVYPNATTQSLKDMPSFSYNTGQSS
jgi:sporulation protein YlmC with PRC-barrel domain